MVETYPFGSDTAGWEGNAHTYCDGARRRRSIIGSNHLSSTRIEYACGRRESRDHRRSLRSPLEIGILSCLSRKESGRAADLVADLHAYYSENEANDGNEHHSRPQTAAAGRGDSRDVEIDTM